MADYYPLLARALKALPEPSAATRKAVYDRARQALIGQLRSLDPPLSDEDIEHERKALDAAIGRLETDFGGASPPAAAPAEALPVKASPAPAVPLPAAPAPDLRAATAREPERSPPTVVPAPPSMPAAAPPVLVSAPPASASETGPATSPDAPSDTAAEPLLVASRAHYPEPEPPSTPPLIVPARPRSRGAPAAEPPAEAAVESEASGGSRQQRPRLDVRPVPGRRAGLLRNLAVALVLLVVIGLIAAAAWALRDKPSDLVAASTQGPSTRAADEAAKLADRVGSDRPAGSTAIPGQGSTAAPAAQTPAPGVAVAQRATLYEENVADPQAPPRVLNGRAVWRLDAINGGQGQPLQTIIRATVEIPEAGGLTLTMTIRRNLDTTLPASHTIELTFTNTGTDPNRSVRDVGLLQLKDDQNGRGSPVAGLPVPVRDNLFLIGLSNLPSDIDRNTDLLQSRNWIDLPIRYASGGRAILSFEKGTPGDRTIRDAFAQWQQ